MSGGINALPEKRLTAGYPLKSGQIDTAARQKIPHPPYRNLANNSYDLDRIEIARGQRDVRAGSAEHAVDFAVRGFYTVVSDGSNNNNGHYPIVLMGMSLQ